MSRIAWAEPRTGPGPADEPDWRPLAGSRLVRFRAARLRRPDGAWESRAARDLPEEAAGILSARRPDLCGLALDRPRVMGIVNVTPDSFSDGGDRLEVAAALDAARRMEEAGADIVDIGGESTRPGADPVPEREEAARVVPVVEAIREAGLRVPVSIDTRKAVVAAAALDAGADMVNDVSAMTFDAGMAGLVAERGVPVCLMHAKGDPRTMHLDPRYDDVAVEVHGWLAERIEAALGAGIPRGGIVADPGIGFGKTASHNLALLRGLALYHSLGVPLLLGASRKRFIGAIGGAEDAKARMPGSIAVALHAAGQGAHILRVHDVAETRQALALWRALANPADETHE